MRFLKALYLLKIASAHTIVDTASKFVYFTS
jgi:hypothetical protein